MMLLPAQLQMMDDGRHKGRDVDLEQYNIISDFTQLVTAPSCDDAILYDQDLFQYWQDGFMAFGHDGLMTFGQGGQIAFGQGGQIAFGQDCGLSLVFWKGLTKVFYGQIVEVNMVT